MQSGCKLMDNTNRSWVLLRDSAESEQMACKKQALALISAYPEQHGGGQFELDKIGASRPSRELLV
eukprot:5354015-Amphidinium_carterae.2